jgi:hypothetical protein
MLSGVVDPDLLRIPTQVPSGVMVGEDDQPIAGLRAAWKPIDPMPADVRELIAADDAAATVAALNDARYDVEIVLIEVRPLPAGADPWRPPKRIKAFIVPRCPIGVRLLFLERTESARGVRVIVG